MKRVQSPIRAAITMETRCPIVIVSSEPRKWGEPEQGTFDTVCLGLCSSAQLCLIHCWYEAPQQLLPCHPKPRAPRHRGPMSQRLTPPRPRRRRRLPDTAPAAVTTVSFDDPGGPTRHALVRVDTGCSLKPSVPSSPYQHII